MPHSPVRLGRGFILKQIFDGGGGLMDRVNNKEKTLVEAFSVIVKLQTSRRFVSSSSVWGGSLGEGCVDGRDAWLPLLAAQNRGQGQDGSL